MSKVIIALILSCTFFSFTLLAIENPKGIEVIGYGIVDVEIERFTVSITVNERHSSATKSQQLVVYKMQLLKDLAQKFITHSKDAHLLIMRAKAIELEPSISVDGVISKQKFANGGYGKVFISSNNLNQSSHSSTNKIMMETSQTMVVSLPSIEKYAQFIDAVTKIGVSHIFSVENTQYQNERYYQQALNLAMANAQKKAKQLAQMMDLHIGRLVFLKEVDISDNKRNETVQSAPNLQIKAEIYARFAIEE